MNPNPDPTTDSTPKSSENVKLCIGDQHPWRLTKESGFKLAKAVVETGATIIASGIDTTCPPTYALVRFSIPRDKLPKFQELIGHPLERIEQASGQ